MKRTIKMIEIKAMADKGIYTFEKKNNSPRGCRTVSWLDLAIGDMVLLDNHFTLIVEG